MNDDYDFPGSVFSHSGDSMGRQCSFFTWLISILSVHSHPIRISSSHSLSFPTAI